MVSQSGLGMVSQESPGFPQAEFVMECYPKTVMPGDMLYFTLVAKNPYDKSLCIGKSNYPGDTRIYLKDSENQQAPYSKKDLFAPDPRLRSPTYINLGISTEEIQSGDSLVFFAERISVPSLVVLNEPFWEKHLKNLSTGDEKFSLCLAFQGHFTETFEDYLARKGATINEFRKEVIERKWDGRDYISLAIPLTFELPIILKQRSEKEMAMIQKWHESLTDYLESDKFKEFGVYGYRSEQPKNIVVKNEKFSHWYFVPFVHLYPDNSSVPETWQGWQELEDSLSPSTMKDEIRLTRILIQYCDTDDDVVLKELKEWIDEMNEVQRTVMAKSIRDRAEHTYGEKLLPQFCEIYKTIREYDVVPIPESKEKHLRDLGLIE